MLPFLQMFFRFLPKLAGASLEKELQEAGITEENNKEGKTEEYLTNSITSEKNHFFFTATSYL